MFLPINNPQRKTIHSGFMAENSAITKNVTKMVSKPINGINRPMDWRQQKRSILINHEVSKFTKAFRENFATLIISALGLVAALSWNDAIKTTIDTLFPTIGNVIYKYYVAVTVTIISVVITYFVSKLKPKQ